MSTITSLEERVLAVREQVADAALDAGRHPGEVTLIAVSKTFPREDIEAAYDLGVRHFGENRVQEAQQKLSVPLPADAPLHLIGHLQSNKAKFVPGLFDTVDSVDRSSIIKALDKAVAKAGETLDVLLQVNIAGEEQKAGCAPAEAPKLIEQIAATGTLAPTGLMTIAPIDAAGDDLRAVFRGLRALRDDLQERFPDLDLRELSMGMSNDYREAIAEGATQ
ncbi:MAG: YggS family pyridoxal phosphate-dependent enzyme, partial [Chloroflexota bacterium]|nr:YggS family pyridoxal phosphate-dependent enzyme [Chloroflexota bacterium]